MIFTGVPLGAAASALLPDELALEDELWPPLLEHAARATTDIVTTPAVRLVPSDRRDDMGVPFLGNASAPRVVL
jgi:hypothetical protein